MTKQKPTAMRSSATSWMRRSEFFSVSVSPFRKQRAAENHRQLRANSRIRTAIGGVNRDLFSVSLPFPDLQTQYQG